MKNHLKILKKCLLFAEIEESELSRLLVCLGAKTVKYDRRQTIFAENEPASHIGIVLSGAAQIEQLDYNGNRTILSILGEGEILAEAFACAGTDALPVNVVAIEPSEVMLLDSQHILSTCSSACSHHRKLIYNLMKDLAIKTLGFHSRMEVTAKRTTREKLLTYLWQEARKNDSRSFEIPFDRQALADYLEVDRSGLSAEISKLRREGVLQSNKSHFVLL